MKQHMCTTVPLFTTLAGIAIVPTSESPSLSSLFAAAITDHLRLGTNFTLTCIDTNNGNHVYQFHLLWTVTILPPIQLMMICYQQRNKLDN